MTALIVGYHVSNRKSRASIRKYGLLPSRPRSNQPMGVYVFQYDRTFDHSTFTASRTVRWEPRDPTLDLWRVGYFGRWCLDPFVRNALVLLDPVTLITLVTCDNDCH